MRLNNLAVGPVCVCVCVCPPLRTTLHRVKRTLQLSVCVCVCVSEGSIGRAREMRNVCVSHYATAAEPLPQSADAVSVDAEENRLIAAYGAGASVTAFDCATLQVRRPEGKAQRARERAEGGRKAVSEREGGKGGR